MLSDKKTRNYYIEKFPKILLTDLNATLNQETAQIYPQVNLRTVQHQQIIKLEVLQQPMKYIEPGAMIKFEATKDSIMKNNEHGLMSGTTDHKFAVITNGHSLRIE